MEKPPFVDDMTLPASVKHMNFNEMYSDDYECHGHAHDLDDKRARTIQLPKPLPLMLRTNGTAQT